MSEGNRYEIKSVGDFLKVPEEKINLCLSEFSEMLSNARELKSFTESIGGNFILPGFTWIDDDKGDVTIMISKSKE